MKASPLLLELMQTQFAAIELNLLLDNHPHCQVILEQYNQLAEQISQLGRQYSQQIEPLVGFGCASSGENPWNWALNPWPWELKY